MTVENRLTKAQHPGIETARNEQESGRKNLRLLKDNLKPGRQKIALNCRIQALKILTLALMNSLEALERAAENGSSGEPQIEPCVFDEVRRFESEIIKSALVQTGGRQRPAARLLGMKSATFNAKVKRYNIDSREIACRAREPRR